MHLLLAFVLASATSGAASTFFPTLAADGKTTFVVSFGRAGSVTSNGTLDLTSSYLSVLSAGPEGVFSVQANTTSSIPFNTTSCLSTLLRGGTAKEAAKVKDADLVACFEEAFADTFLVPAVRNTTSVQTYYFAAVGSSKLSDKQECQVDANATHIGSGDFKIGGNSITLNADTANIKAGKSNLAYTTSNGRLAEVEFVGVNGCFVGQTSRYGTATRLAGTDPKDTGVKGLFLNGKPKKSLVPLESKTFKESAAGLIHAYLDSEFSNTQVFKTSGVITKPSSLRGLADKTGNI